MGQIIFIIRGLHNGIIDIGPLYFNPADQLPVSLKQFPVLLQHFLLLRLLVQGIKGTRGSLRRRRRRCGGRRLIFQLTEFPVGALGAICIIGINAEISQAAYRCRTGEYQNKLSASLSPLQFLLDGFIQRGFRPAGRGSLLSCFSCLC